MSTIIRFSAFLTCLSLSSAIVPVPAVAHSGGLNAAGCHAGSQPYHCHRSQREMVTTSDGRNRLRCDLGSQSRECTGSTSQSNAAVRNLQSQLQRHCRNLPSNFADGIYGTSTQQALVRFQQAYGLVPDGTYGPATERALAMSPTGQC